MHLYDLPLLLPIIYQFYLEKYQGLKKEVRQAIVSDHFVV